MACGPGILALGLARRRESPVADRGQDIAETVVGGESVGRVVAAAFLYQGDDHPAQAVVGDVVGDDGEGQARVVDRAVQAVAGEIAIEIGVPIEHLRVGEEGQHLGAFGGGEGGRDARRVAGPVGVIAVAERLFDRRPGRVGDRFDGRRRGEQGAGQGEFPS